MCVKTSPQARFPLISTLPPRLLTRQDHLAVLANVLVTFYIKDMCWAPARGVARFFHLFIRSVDMTAQDAADRVLDITDVCTNVCDGMRVLVTVSETTILGRQHRQVHFAWLIDGELSEVVSSSPRQASDPTDFFASCMAEMTGCYSDDGDSRQIIANIVQQMTDHTMQLAAAV